LGVGAEHGRVQQRQHGDLVVPADRREHRADRRIGEGGVQVGGPVGRGRPELPRGGVLDRDQTQFVADPAHGLLVHRRPDRGRGERGRHDRDAVAGPQLRGGEHDAMQPGRRPPPQLQYELP
jgi:hypothetical protein